MIVLAKCNVCTPSVPNCSSQDQPLLVLISFSSRESEIAGKFWCTCKCIRTVFITFSISGRTVAGTTDTPTKLTFSPKPTKSDVQFILDEIKDYLSDDITGKL